MKYPGFFAVWLVLAVAYIGSLFLNILPLSATIGLFVPYGIWNFSFALAAIIKGNYLPVLPAILLLVLIFRLDRMLEKSGVTSGFVRVLIYLTVLFCLTVVTDFSIWGHWKSLEIYKPLNL